MSDIQNTAAGEAADKLAVVEALYRYCAGIDLRDQALLASSFSENTVLDFRPAGAKSPKLCPRRWRASIPRTRSATRG
jgi:hypothetical protein